jgi:hypothetical protein
MSAATGYKLTERIVELSVAKTWPEAKEEWQLATVYFTETGQYSICLCGHSIRECCLLVNRHSGREALVGNCCVKKFLDLYTEAVFTGLKRIAEDPTKALNPATIKFARSRGWLTAWECKFLIDTARKQQLSPRQREIRTEINHKVLAEVAGEDRCHA